jgi:hypothetical protein
MDVTCATCGEPWDTYHLRHDAVWDAMSYLPEGMTELVGDYSERGVGPTAWIKPVMDAMRKAGWRFGGSVLAVIRCPDCPKDRPTNTARAEVRRCLSEVLGDDEDALASMLEGYDDSHAMSEDMA